MKIVNRKVKFARERGKEAYKAGIDLTKNPYRVFTNKGGSISLSAMWEVGWKMAELEEKDPDKFRELNKGE
ncbi:MAG: hypothetical protein OEZ01_07480 [Candidatus Heimdallarchaeota archaeon]|nr:hypothetical protein [Candidatus Heimdallarchaeota archaeon]